jgi:hypothetical protein
MRYLLDPCDAMRTKFKNMKILGSIKLKLLSKCKVQFFQVMISSKRCFNFNNLIFVWERRFKIVFDIFRCILDILWTCYLQVVMFCVDLVVFLDLFTEWNVLLRWYIWDVSTSVVHVESNMPFVFII